MQTLPAELLNLIVVFQPLFTKPTWENVKVLLLGALLARGKPNGYGLLAGRWAGPRRAFSELPSGTQSCEMERASGRQDFARIDRSELVCRRKIGSICSPAYLLPLNLDKVESKQRRSKFSGHH
jgi:hypothetical protein